jgi:hypothetical protein
MCVADRDRTRGITAVLEPKSARYVTLRALPSFHGGPYTSVGEINVLTPAGESAHADAPR